MLIKVMDDYGCSPLWVWGPDEYGGLYEPRDPAELGLSPSLVGRLAAWQQWSDSMVNIADPNDSRPISDAEHDALAGEGRRLAARVAEELPDASVWYYGDPSPRLTPPPSSVTPRLPAIGGYPAPWFAAAHRAGDHVRKAPVPSEAEAKPRARPKADSGPRRGLPLFGGGTDAPGRARTPSRRAAGRARRGDAGDGGVLVLLGGEAGGGKTALVRRFCRQTQGPVLWGACDPLFTPRPLGPFTDIAQDAGGELQDLLAAGAKPYQVAAAIVRGQAHRDHRSRGPALGRRGHARRPEPARPPDRRRCPPS